MRWSGWGWYSTVRYTTTGTHNVHTVCSTTGSLLLLQRRLTLIIPSPCRALAPADYLYYRWRSPAQRGVLIPGLWLALQLPSPGTMGVTILYVTGRLSADRSGVEQAVSDDALLRVYQLSSPRAVTANARGRTAVCLTRRNCDPRRADTLLTILLPTCHFSWPTPTIPALMATAPLVIFSTRNTTAALIHYDGLRNSTTAYTG